MLAHVVCEYLGFSCAESHAAIRPIEKEFPCTCPSKNPHRLPLPLTPYPLPISPKSPPLFCATPSSQGSILRLVSMTSAVDCSRECAWHSARHRRDIRHRTGARFRNRLRHAAERDECRRDSCRMRIDARSCLCGDGHGSVVRVRICIP